MPRRSGIEYHPSRSVNTDLSIVTQSFVGAHLDEEAEEIYNFSLWTNDDPMNPNAVRGSENLLMGLLYSDQAVAYLKQFGIMDDEVAKIGLGQRTSELTLVRYKESFPYRTIFSLAAVLARQEGDKQNYRISGKHFVEAIRRTPQSAAYRSLQALSTRSDF